MCHPINATHCGCSEGKLLCGNGMCLDRSKFCDGTDDCMDGTDEPDNCKSDCGVQFKYTAPQKVSLKTVWYLTVVQLT